MAVTTAIDEYLQAEDTFAQWVEECCTVGEPSRHKETNRALFASWKLWCEGVGEQPSTQKGLSDALIRAGFKRCSIGHARGFAGLVLKPSSG
jgi:phage/plasmid-associated DNA primase